MPRLDGVEATRRILERVDARVVVVSSSTASEDVAAACAAGAAAYLVKHAPPTEVVDAVVSAAVPPIPNYAPAADLRSDGGGVPFASAA